MGVLTKVCLDPIMAKGYAEAEIRLRKNPKFIEYEKACEAVHKIRAKIDRAEERFKRELENIKDYFEENDLSTPYVNFYLNYVPNEIEVKKEGRKVFVEMDNRHCNTKTIEEPVDMSSSEAMAIIDEAMDLAELCTKELELINLIRETKERIAALPSEPKKASKKKPKKKPKKK